MNTKEIFETQILDAISSNKILRPVEKHVLSHVMNVRPGTKACAAVGHVVKAFISSCTIWKEEIEDSTQLAVRCLQIYSERSWEFLLARSYSFNILQVTLLDSTERLRRTLIVTGLTVFAYLLVNFLDSGSPATQRNKRIRNITSIHQCVNYAVNSLANCKLNGRKCVIGNERTLLLRLMTVCFVADIPEAEDLLSVK